MIVTCLLGLKKLSLTYPVCSFSLLLFFNIQFKFFTLLGVDVFREEIEEESRCFLLKAVAGRDIITEGSNNYSF